MQAIYVLLLSLFVSMVLIPPLSRLAGPLGLTDRPGGRKIHQVPVPRTGGVAIVAGTLVSVLLWVPMRPDLLAFVVAAGLLFLFGVLDDRFNLDYRFKLLGQTLAALIVTVGGGVLIQDIPFIAAGSLPAPFALGLTVFVLVGLTNAVNLSDGLDGLAGGISLLALGCLSVLAYQGEDPAALMVAFAMMGATFGFLRFNTNPAQIFMGDTGSQFLGFGTGVLAIIVTQRADSAVGTLIPILILGLPILDTITVMVRRIAAGRSPFSADRLHLHHQLLRAGLTQYEAVVLVYAAQALLIAMAYFMRYSADAAVLSAYLAFAALLLFGVGLLSRHHAQLEPSSPRLERQPVGMDLLVFLNRARLLTNGPFLLLNVAVPLVLLLGALSVPAVSTDVGALTGLLLVAFLLALWLSSPVSAWIERLTVYVVAVAVVHLAPERPGLADQDGLVLALFVVIGVLTAIWVRFASDAFQVSSLDMLILLIAVLMPVLPGPWFEAYGMEVLQSVILFYAIEVLMAERKRPWDPLRLGALGALATLSLKGLLWA